MESKTNINILKLFLSIASFLFLPYLTIASSSKITNTTLSPSKIVTPSPSKITAIFGFGDSTIDTGNNNYLPTTSRADHPPYGRDFPYHKSNGRFTNAQLPIDLIIASLGLKKLLPPYLNPAITHGVDLLTGVSFGSGSAGLDPLTSQSANVLTVPDQINLFDQALTGMRRFVGQRRAKAIVEKALFFFSVGTNDFTNYYDLGQRATEYSISGYQDFILQRYKDAIRNLYNRGARRFTVTSLSSVGCLPIQITLANVSNPRRCIESQSIDSIAYNAKLRQLVTRLETQLQGSKIAYYDVYDTMFDMVNNPAKYGFEKTFKGCCGTGLFEYGPTCTPTTPTCPDASKYLFFDAVHPTLAAYKVLANLALQTVIPYVTA